ncbi:MAG: aspartate--tRNA(Asn) ligase [Chloroflexi bacterium]|nr:aspartate--tRNA(Asn) ligase [Chloroflexota bacterium]
MQRILAAEIGAHVGERVRLQGWLHILRALGEVNFLVLRDRSGMAQSVLTPAELAPLEGLAVESVIEIEGKVIAAPPAPGGFELHEVQVRIITPIAEAPPIEINKKQINVSLPVFLDHAVVGHRNPEKRAVLKLAAGVMQGFRSTLAGLDFTEIQTPKLVASSTEGGAEVYAVEHFDKMAYLAQSPQFYKQIMVGVFERVFEVGPVFRAEKHSTRRHANEYVSLDVEFGFIENHFTVMRLLTQVIEGILNHLTVCYAPELAALKVVMPKVAHDAEKQTFPHIRFHEAQVMLTEKHGVTDAIGEPDLTPEHERLLGQWALDTYGSDFVFVVGYPMKKRPFYTHPNPEEPEFSNSFDLLFRGTELVTGGQRLHLYEDYINSAQKRGYSLEPFEKYFEAFKYGMPPHGGFAIGLERFVMQLCNLDNIRLATLFPRDIHRLTP